VKYLNGIDYGVILAYCAVLLVMGFYLQRRASVNLEAYFLGGKQLPWWALGVSGMLNFLDMTGTMVIVSFLYMLGPQGLYIEFRGGAVLVLAFMMLWAGKWHRRSNCMTGAEWNIYRFGTGPAAQAARFITAAAGVLFAFGMLAYLIKGAGLFLSMFLPYSPMVCAVIMVGLTTVYTVTAGFYGVVYTDMFQAAIVLISVIVISCLAFAQVTGYEGDLGALAREVTGSTNWISSAPSFHVDMPRGYEDYESLFLFALFYLIRNIIGGMGQGADPRYFGARNERECGLLTFFWTWLMTFRWPMMMGFAVMGLFLVHKAFPRQEALSEAEIAIKEYLVQRAGQDASQLDLATASRVAKVLRPSDWEAGLKAWRAGTLDSATAGGLQEILGADWPDRLTVLIARHKQVSAVIAKHQWEETMARILQRPDEHPALVERLRGILGPRWDELVNLVSYEGTVNPERILPAVILMRIPMGLRGLLVVSLVAAAMSTFAPTVNGTVSLMTRDIYQGFIRPRASNFELIAASYVFGIILVIGGFAMAYFTRSINDIWDWIIMALTAGLAIPQLLRLYWWRFNAGGVIVGTAVAMVASVIERVLSIMEVSQLTAVWKFVVLTGVSLIGAILGTLLTRPTEPRVVWRFYRTTRPFGFWGPLKRLLDPQTRAAMDRENFYDIVSVPFALTWQITLFLLPMQAMVLDWHSFSITLVIFVVSLTGLMLLWYRHLPKEQGPPPQFDPTVEPTEEPPGPIG